VETYHKLGLQCLICIGGDGTMSIAYVLSQHGVNVVGVPKTIDNDLMATDVTFGYNRTRTITHRTHALTWMLNPGLTLRCRW
jgi:6-phosphofructokinase